MSTKRSKSMVFDLVVPDGKARLKHQSLVQDYVELQKEVDALRGTLDEAKQRKLILAAEVRFLRRRHKQLVETKNMNMITNTNTNTVNEHLNHLPVLAKPTKKRREKQVIRNGLPPVPEPKPRKKQCTTNKQAVVPDSLPPTVCSRKKIIHGERNEPIQGRMHVRKEASPILGNSMFSLNEMSSRASVPAFDLNLDSRPSGEGTSLPRAPIFDLNQVSTGDEDFVELEATKFEEAMNDLKLSICRNAGEGSSRVGKRKISWQDPVALSV